MRFAYADPPYLGCGSLYSKHHSEALNWNKIETHEDLIHQLAEFDGWAMSLSAPSLKQILPLCPEDVRIAAWVKPFAVFKKGINPVYAWEPVIFHGIRKRGLEEPHVKDWVSANITMKKGLPGAKPAAFCDWILDVLGYQEGDTMEDLFPGTGSMEEALCRRSISGWKQAPLFESI
tara:strand:+ start:10654 stop:11181 length:528 start_codon:yes stop_codon:yes gene_type:complete